MSHNVIQVLSILGLVRATQKKKSKIQQRVIHRYELMYYVAPKPKSYQCSISLCVQQSLCEKMRDREREEENKKKKCFLHTKKKKHESAPHIWYLTVTSFFFFILTADGQNSNILPPNSSTSVLTILPSFKTCYQQETRKEQEKTLTNIALQLPP